MKEIQKKGQNRLQEKNTEKKENKLLYRCALWINRSLKKSLTHVTEKRWGKQSYLETSREDIRGAHTILTYCFTDSLC